jgi:hypothetical protein
LNDGLRLDTVDLDGAVWEKGGNVRVVKAYHETDGGVKISKRVSRVR